MSQELEDRLHELERRVQDLQDREAIRDRIMRYGRGIDRNDGQLVADTFWPDALVDHGHSKFSGDTIGDYFGTVSTATTHRQVHYMMNIVIDVNGDLAISETQAWYLAETSRNDVDYTINRSVRYIDRWERRNGEWRVFHRTVPETWNKLEAITERFPNPGGIVYAQPDTSDISYHLFELNRKGEKPPLERPDNEENWKHARERLDSAGFTLPSSARRIEREA
jgi:hypothetical protein